MVRENFYIEASNSICFFKNKFNQQMKNLIPKFGLLVFGLLLGTHLGAQVVVNVGINQPPAPVSAFSQAPNGLTIDFTDMSTTNIVSWLWDFGDGNTSSLQNPSHTYAIEGNYTVCLTATDVNGCSDTTCIPTGVLVGLNEPAALALFEAFPNPYEGKVNIRYQLSESSEVSLRVVDVLGKEVAVLADEEQSPGTKTYAFSARSLGLEAGIYFVVLEAGGRKAVRKLIEL